VAVLRLLIFYEGLFKLYQNVQQPDFYRCISAHVCFSTNCALGHNTLDALRYRVLNPVGPNWSKISPLPK